MADFGVGEFFRRLSERSKKNFEFGSAQEFRHRYLVEALQSKVVF